MRGIVDRIEGGMAIIETEAGMIELAAVEHLRDGDVVEIEHNRIIAIDRAETDRRRARIQARLDRMLKKKKQ